MILAGASVGSKIDHKFTENATESCADSFVDSCVETETESSITCSSSKRVSYSEYDLLIIREECHDIIHSQESINTLDLKRIFNENCRLQPLLKKFGFNSLKIKMRTERNKAK